MKKLLLTILCFLILCGCGREVPVETTLPPIPETTVEVTETTEIHPPETEPVPEPADSDFVVVAEYIPDILVELRYATVDNFVRQEIYGFTDAYLRYGTVKKLAAVQQTLAQSNLQLKIWDGFRPVSAQFVLWETCPDPAYVADPNVGYSSHSRGNTVDVTLADAQGNELPMPTGFDDFSSLADRNYGDCDEEKANNALLLQEVMEENGFTGYFGEWWHFSDTTEYPVDQVFDPGLQTQDSEKDTVSLQYPLYRAVCENYISLRTEPDAASQVITRIPAGGTFLLMEWCDPFALVEYNGVTGYVIIHYIESVY